MKILFLTNNENSLPLAEWIRGQGDKVTVRGDKIFGTLFSEAGNLRGTEFVVSYNYIHMIGEDVINLFPLRIVNLHISMLPHNRGFSPNFWSFADNTPKGVTVHLVDKGLDTGDILLQKEICFDEKRETFESAYAKLHEEIQTLFKDNYNALKTGKLPPQKQRGAGSYHNKKDLENVMLKHSFKWSDNISDIINKIRGEV